jgi:hypothetical protein
MANKKPICAYPDYRQLAANDYLQVGNLRLKSGGDISAGAVGNAITANATAFDYNSGRWILPTAAATPALVDMVAGQLMLITTGKLAACSGGFRWELALTDAGSGLWYCTLT